MAAQESKPFFSGRCIFATFVWYVVFSSYTFWSSYTESISMQMATISSPYSAAHVFCPESLALSNRTKEQEQRIKEMHTTNEELLKTNEELLEKLKKKNNDTKHLRIQLLQMSRRVHYQAMEEVKSPHPPAASDHSIGGLLRYLPLNTIDVNDLHMSDYMADTVSEMTTCWLVLFSILF